jgi:hypothetical protein
MSTAFKYAAIALAVFVIALAAAQFYQPDRTNPAIVPAQTIEAHLGKGNALVAVLDRACRDCHSNETRWPSYTRVSPVSWLMAYGAKKGRSAVNFSEWGAYSRDEQHALLAASCEDASKGKMPDALYATLQPEARLSPQDIEAICSAARQAPAE